MTADDSLPTRVHNLSRAKLRYPKESAGLLPALVRSDPLADQVIEELADLSPQDAHALILRVVGGASDGPPALRRLLQECSVSPEWIDWERVDRAGAVFFRAGILGGLALGMRSLVYGYAAPAGNKPLALSGALERKAQRRLAETSKFVAAVCTRGGLHPGAEGFAYCVHVRLMHAQVRALSLRDPRWNARAWGLPINQHDMLATVLLFSVVFLGGLRSLGLNVSADEEEDFIHLWRVVGHYLGVEETLLPWNTRQAKRQADFIRITQGPPDEDSRALVRALLSEPVRQAHSARDRRLAERHVAFARELCAALIDEETARGLGLGAAEDGRVLIRIARVMRLLERIRVRVPQLDPLIQSVGKRYWVFTSSRGLAATSAFVLPRTLSGVLRPQVQRCSALSSPHNPKRGRRDVQVDWERRARRFTSVFVRAVAFLQKSRNQPALALVCLPNTKSP